MLAGNRTEGCGPDRKQARGAWRGAVVSAEVRDREEEKRRRGEEEKKGIGREVRDREEEREEEKKRRSSRAAVGSEVEKNPSFLLEADLPLVRVAERVEVLAAGVLDHGRRPAHEHERLVPWSGEI